MADYANKRRALTSFPPWLAVARKWQDDDAGESFVRQLLLMRHAKSSWDDPKLSDHARPLNVRGKRAARAMRGALLAAGLVPDVVLVSSARRSLQTMEGLLPWEGRPLIAPMDALYLASAAQLMEVLRAADEAKHSLLVIAHNPGLYDLALRLIGPDEPASEAMRRLSESYPSGSLAAFDVIRPWEDLGEGAGRLTHFLCPRDLPEMAL